MPRRSSLDPQLNQIRDWVGQGRTVPWIAYQLEVLVSELQASIRERVPWLGKVVKTTTFGAFVELGKHVEGLLHISNVAPGRRVSAVEEVLNKGDEVRVSVVEVDQRTRTHWIATGE